MSRTKKIKITEIKRKTAILGNKTHKYKNINKNVKYYNKLKTQKGGLFGISN